MNYGYLIAYDSKGNVYIIDGEAQGDILPRELPESNLKVMELPFGALEGVEKFHIENDVLIVDKYFEIPPTLEEIQAENEELKMQLLFDSGVI